jgi:hypothetical protein
MTELLRFSSVVCHPSCYTTHLFAQMLLTALSEVNICKVLTETKC